MYYGATHVEAQRCKGDEVAIVGGGNSAGQAAVYLSGVVRHVHMLIRGEGLADSMSRYLIRRIEETPNITLRTRTRLESLEGGDHLESVVWTDNRSGETTRRDVRHLFLMTGAKPNSDWLSGCVVLDDKGFVKTEWIYGRGPLGSKVAHEAYSLSSGDESARSLRRRRHPCRERQTCGFRRRRGVHFRIELVHRALSDA